MPGSSPPSAPRLRCCRACRPAFPRPPGSSSAPTIISRLPGPAPPSTVSIRSRLHRLRDPDVARPSLSPALYERRAVKLLKFLASIGGAFLEFLTASGRIVLFALWAIYYGVRPPYYPRLILRQMVDIGYYSL